MGTNYYVVCPDLMTVCSECGIGRPGRHVHLGKSSVGWVFALRCYIEGGMPDTLEAWQRFWSKEGRRIENEYGDRVDPHTMLRTIRSRSAVFNSTTHLYGYFYGRPLPKDVSADLASWRTIATKDGRIRPAPNPDDTYDCHFEEFS